MLKLFGKKESENKNSSGNHYMTGKEIREIAKANAKEMRRLEKAKFRSVPQSEYTTEMKDEKNILEVEDLHSYFFTDQGVVKAVNGVSFEIPLNSTVGVVGESGCGKSVTSMSIMRLLQGPSGQIVSGSIRFKANDFKRDENGEFIPVYKRDEKGEIIYEDVTDASGNVVCDRNGNPKRRPVQEIGENGLGVYEKEECVFDIAKMPINEMYRLRGRQLSMVFQEPMTSLNPVFTIGNQLDEVSLLHVPGATKEFAKKRSIEMLDMVGISMPERVYASYPHELSGGMRQRLAMARALTCDADLLLMDEPLSALDALLREEMQDMLKRCWCEQGYAQVLVTHSIEEAVYLGQRIVVMSPRPGRVVHVLENAEMQQENWRDADLFFERCRALREMLRDIVAKEEVAHA